MWSFDEKHVEIIVLMGNEKSKPGSYIDLMMDVSDIRRRAAGESPDGEDHIHSI